MKNEIAKLLLLGQYGLKKYISKSDCLQIDLFKLIRYIRDQFAQISVQNMGCIMKGLAVVYFIQVKELEGDTKMLLSQLNGDYAWNNFVKKMNRLESPVKQ